MHHIAILNLTSKTNVYGVLVNICSVLYLEVVLYKTIVSWEGSQVCLVIISLNFMTPDITV